MLTQRIDAALDALATARERLPVLREVFSPAAPERSAIDDLLAALDRADAAMQSSARRPRDCAHGADASGQPPQFGTT